MSEEKDYKNSVILPQTDFPMRAGLATKEPLILEKWAKMGLQKRMQEEFKDRPNFFLNDGPSTVNAPLHMGHAFQKTLKDATNKYQQVIGKNASHYSVGWDCNGLPIEWKVMGQYKDMGVNHEEVPILEFRKKCREYARQTGDIQKSQTTRLGVFADWDLEYTTMNADAQADIVRKIHTFLMNGALNQGLKPIMWDIPGKSSLAEAEIEYLDHKSTTIWVRFTVQKTNCEAIDGADIVIWTTTPWTIPGNRAVACHKDFNYGVYEVKAVDDSKATAKVGEKLVLLETLAEATKIQANITEMEKIASVKGSDIIGSITSHPWAGKGYDFDVPVLEADFVTEDTGTGFVHIAPGHGPDDYFLGIANGVEVPDTVGEDGKFIEGVPLFEGQAVYTSEGKEGTANVTSIKELFAAGKLLAKGSVRHEYPHSWKTKSPVIFRTTPQWFIDLDKNDLRKNALDQINNNVNWLPKKSINRITSFVANRPDWCLSRQQRWGTPLALFLNKKTGEVLRDAEVNERIALAFEEDNADAWFARDKQEFLGDKYKLEDYDAIDDTVDVWFDSGCVWSYVMNNRDYLQYPADLYLEGSDQHRGWFNSSLLISVGVNGIAPYKTCFSHGFLVDEKGYKMGKSSGNAIDPSKVMDTQGSDILRTWAINCDYHEDVKVGPNILKQQSDVYRKIRNTLRFMLGNLPDGKVEEFNYGDLPELEKYILNKMSLLSEELRKDAENYNLKGAFEKTYEFCVNDLSAFYFDIRKDCLYCDAEDSLERRACIDVINTIFDFVCIWLSPVISFTAEEAWFQRHKDDNDSVFLHTAGIPKVKDLDLDTKWNKIRRVRKNVTHAIELLRADKTIGSSLQAKPVVEVYSEELFKTLSSIDMAEICITSDMELNIKPLPSTDSDFNSILTTIETATGDKCERCWRILEEVGQSGEPICDRCAKALS